MVRCPRCGNENGEPAREWVGGAKTSKPMNVQRFVCSSCGTGYVAWKNAKTGQVKIMTRKG